MSILRFLPAITRPAKFSQSKYNFVVVRKRSRAQTVLETFFVLFAMIFLAFTMLNFTINIHTKSIATYAAFMAGRSYQVYGNRAGADQIQEHGSQTLLDDQQVIPVLRVAEDIFTCGLPWVRVPEGDLENSSVLNFQDQDSQAALFRSCAEGKRKYESTNINRRLTVFRFDNSVSVTQAQASGRLLEEVQGAFAEPNREALRFAILKLQYKQPLVLNILGVYDRYNARYVENGQVQIEENVTDRFRNSFWHDVHVPLLLNPGLDSGVEIADQGAFGQGNNDDRDEEAQDETP